ncbi:hypothetical protein FZC79_10490 [Rossellomorea vietnamensis]|uniref:Phage tail tape measure protein domain-containing protein n=1 Tax=Rossellomorea vietnamensis TaxID=218284 RepID=A0A5D4KF97_9BACI|nr:phage tail tape measure protein [Rossellomorea vietnamensis]TYR75586.1 hypothetical protein FZC79_10490 [Rossellomorea vietnamensis]
MSKNIKGITIELDGDTKGLNKALSSVNSRSKELQTELRDVDRLLKFSPGNTELIAQKQKLLADQVDNTSTKLKQLKSAEQEVQQQFAKGQIKEEQYRAFQREIVETESKLKTFGNKLASTKQQAKSFGDSLKDVGEKAKTVGNNLKETGENMKGAGANMVAGVTLPLAALGTFAGKAASDVESSQGRMQAQLGLTSEEAEKLNGIAQSLWQNAFGESMAEAADGVAIVSKNMKLIDPSQLESASEKAFILRDAFGAELTESTKTANNMMINFGISANEAFDLMTRGFQEGGDYSGELLDTLNEYSPQFATMGHSARDMMNILISGAEAGAFNLDKVGDAMKEFNIRAKDGSDATAEGFQIIGLNAEQMGNAIAAGGEKGEQAFQATVAALAAIEDPVKRNQAGVALFGTQFEDLEADVISAMGTTTNQLGTVEGATQRAGDSLYDNFGTRLTEAWREMQAELIPLGNTLLSLAEQWLPKVSAAVQKLADWFNELGPTGQTMVLVLGGVAAAIGPLIIVIGSLISGIGGLITIAGALNISIAAIAGPIAIAVAAIAGLVTAGVLLYKNWDQVKAYSYAIWGSIEKMFSLFFSTVKGIFNAGLSFIDAQTKGRFSSITNAIRSYMKMVSGIVSSIFSFVKSTFSNSLSFLKSLVTGDFRGMWKAVKDQMGNISGTISSIWGDVMEFFQGIDLKEIGKDIIRGLVKGIGSMAGSIMEKVEELASNIPKWAKKILGIHSPSRVMRDEVGKEIGAGLAQGMDDSQKEVEKSAEELAKSAFEASKKFVDERKYYNEMSLEGELKAWQRVQKQYKKGTDQRKEADREVYRLKKEIIKKQEELELQAFNKSKEYISDKKHYNKLSLQEELSTWERVMVRYEEGTEIRKQAEKEVYRVKKEINDKLIAINQEYSNKVKDTNDKMIQQEKALTEEYQKTLNSRAGSLYSFAGIFDEVKIDMEVTGQDLINNLKGQVVTFEEWATNIESLAKRGIGEGLLSELRELGPKAAAEIKALTTLSDEELAAYEEIWAKKHKLANEQATKELEGMRKETAIQIKELRSDSEKQLEALKVEWIDKIKGIKEGTKDEFTDMKSIGKNAVEGLIDGMGSMMGELVGQSKAIAETVQKAIKEALDINSPSRVTTWMGEMIGEGLQTGMNNSLRGIQNMSEKLALATIPSKTSLTHQMNEIQSSSTMKPEQPIIIQSVLDGKIVAESTYTHNKRKLHRDMTIANRTGGDWK